MSAEISGGLIGLNLRLDLTAVARATPKISIIILAQASFLSWNAVHISLEGRSLSTDLL